MIRRSMLAAAALAAAAGPAAAQTQISWWHAMTGANSEVVEKIATDFNASQSDYELVPVFKGTYPETLNAGIAAFRAGQPPRHHPGLRRRHRRDDGRRGRDQAGRRGADRGRHGVRQERSTCRASSPTTPGPTARCCPSPTTPPRRSSTTTRTSSQKAGLDVENPPKTWHEVWDAAKQDQGERRGALRLYLDLAHLDPPRELRRLEQPALRHATRTASAAGTPS